MGKTNWFMRNRLNSLSENVSLFNNTNYNILRDSQVWLGGESNQWQDLKQIWSWTSLWLASCLEPSTYSFDNNNNKGQCDT